MKRRTVKGIVAALCLTLLAPAAAAVMPGTEMVVSAEPLNESVKVTPEKQQMAVAELKALSIGKDLNEDQKNKIDSILAGVYSKIGYTGGEVDDESSYNTCQYTIQELDVYVNMAKADIGDVINPPADDDDDEEDEPDPVVTPDHLLMVGGSWVTPVADAGEAVSIVLPVVNMGKTMVTDAVVTPALSTDTSSWPFEITSSNYS